MNSFNIKHTKNLAPPASDYDGRVVKDIPDKEDSPQALGW